VGTRNPSAGGPDGVLVGLGRFELPTSRLSDISRALVGAGERWQTAILTDSALVGAGQRWWAVIQVVLQLQIDPTITTPSTKTRSQGIWASIRGDQAVQLLGLTSRGPRHRRVLLNLQTEKHQRRDHTECLSGSAEWKGAVTMPRRAVGQRDDVRH